MRFILVVLLAASALLLPSAANAAVRSTPDTQSRVEYVAPSQLTAQKYVVLRQTVGDSVYTTSASVPLKIDCITVYDPVYRRICPDTYASPAYPFINTATPTLCDICPLSPDYTGQGEVTSGFGETADVADSVNVRSVSFATFGDNGDVSLHAGGQTVSTGSGRYGCYRVKISRVKETFSVYRWGITLDKTWCGYTRGRITSQDKVTYISTGTNVSQRTAYYSYTQMVNRSHGNSYSHGYFHDCWGAFCKDDDPVVGLNFYANGDFKPYQYG